MRDKRIKKGCPRRGAFSQVRALSLSAMAAAKVLWVEDHQKAIAKVSIKIQYLYLHSWLHNESLIILKVFHNFCLWRFVRKKLKWGTLNQVMRGTLNHGSMCPVVVQCAPCNQDQCF